MDHFADWSSLVRPSVCIVDDTGRIVREVRVASEPEALLAVLKSPAYRWGALDWKLDRCRNGCSVPALIPKRHHASGWPVIVESEVAAMSIA